MIKTLFVTSGLLAALVPASRNDHKQDREDKKAPNIIFLLTDDQRYNALGCMGNDEILTPNIDRIAEMGTIFTHYYNTTAICMASRAEIMTGMYEYKTGCNFQHGPLNEEKFSQSYPVLLRNAGYRTGFAGKFGFAVTGKDDKDNSNYGSMDRLPVDAFDWWRGWPGQGYYETAKNEYMVEYAEEFPHVSRALGKASTDFIKESAKIGKPFCLSVSFKAPHSPERPDPAFDEVYRNKTFTKPCNYGVEAAGHLPEQSKQDRQFKRLGKRWAPDSYDEALASYYQQIYGVDVAVGMILDVLKELDIDDNTILIFTTDNGYFCGAHGFGGKVLPYEEGSRAPLIIYDPVHCKTPAVKTSEALSGNIDIAPTILEMAGLNQPDNMDGMSLLPVLDGRKTSVKDHQLFIQSWGNPAIQSMAVMTPEYKYIYWYYGEDMVPAEELYRRDDSCPEMINRAADPAYEEILTEMQGLYDLSLKKWEKECVSSYRYADYPILFDRKLQWEDKRSYVRFVDENDE